jgi:uncharacterized protein YodC (DUF2158 family)
MMEFEKGDRVRFKTLGHVMEVSAIEKSVFNGKTLYVTCHWTSPKKKHYSERFKPDELVLIERAKQVFPGEMVTQELVSLAG